MKISPLNLMTLAYTLDVEGFDSRLALRRCGIASLEAMKEDDDWVLAEQFDQLMAAAIEVTGDPAFGLVAGKSIALMRYGPMVPLVLSTPTLRQLLADLRQFAPLVLDRSEVELAEGPQGARLVVQASVQGGLSQHFRTEMVATSSLQMLRLAMATGADIYRVEFPYACPPGRHNRYVATFGPNISFELKECAIHFNPALLDAPSSMHNPGAYVAARTRAESALAAKLARSDMAERVRQWLLTAFPNQPTTAETAEQLKISERSLRRHLSNLGVTHADLAQECQRLMAERLLADCKASLKQVADGLGFSSVSSFHRAFRRWTGQTPQTWRGNQSGAGGSGP
jgi:AraC-like DNA-binding protein